MTPEHKIALEKLWFDKKRLCRQLETFIERVEADAIQRTEEELADGLTAAHMAGYAKGKTDGIRRTREAVKSGISAKLSEYSKDGNARYLLGLKDALEISMTVEVR